MKSIGSMSQCCKICSHRMYNVVLGVVTNFCFQTYFAKYIIERSFEVSYHDKDLLIAPQVALMVFILLWMQLLDGAKTRIKGTPQNIRPNKIELREFLT